MIYNFNWPGIDMTIKGVIVSIPFAKNNAFGFV